MSASKLSQVYGACTPVTSGIIIRADQWCGMMVMPKSPTEHHDIIVRMYKQPVGSRIVLGVVEWFDAAHFLEMSAHVMNAFKL